MKEKIINPSIFKFYYLALIFSYLICVIVLFQTIQYNIQVKRSAIESMKAQNTVLARILEENVSQTINAVNQILFDIKNNYEAGNIDLIDFQEKQIPMFKEMYTLLTIIDEKGKTVSFSDPSAISLNVIDRQYYQYHKMNKKAKVFIGYPSLGRSTGKWFIPMSLRLEKSDGSFAGVALMSFKPDYFIDIFKHISKGRVFLYNENGIIIAHWSDDNANEIGKDYSPCDVYPKSKVASQGITISPSIFDNVIRIRAFKKLSDHNITIVVTNSQDNAYAGVRPYLKAYNAYSIFLIILIFLFSTWLFIINRKEHIATCLLKESEIKLSLILNTMSEGVVVLQDYQIKYFNPAALQILNVDETQLNKMNFEEFVTNDKGNSLKDKYDLLISGHAEVIEKEFHIKQFDGKTIWVRVDTSTVQWQSKPAILISFDDITEQKEWSEKDREHTHKIEMINQDLAKEVAERKMLANERIKMINTLKSKNEELERFVYTVSHDLRSPLVTVKGFTNFVKQGIMSQDYENVLDDLEKVLFSADKMTSLIDDLLEVSRAGRMISELTTVNIESIVQDVIRVMQIMINTQNVDITVETKIPDVYGDEKKIRQIYQNLLENAIKYAKPNTIPSIFLGYNDKEKAFYVRDKGIGISLDYSEKVFDVFTKISNLSTGSGIGLSIVKKIVETHEGKIWYESNSEGTTFYFTLNLSNSEHNENNAGS
ncbi:MAG TPA: ATP-binding protein [Candidatus Cloacimonadota bacterium]|mgnify:CR=1 FL=1|nr:ATP-binding protein [Candidatus Cloacimonadota bacterium]HQB41069.1 ATP-binding protein [Candidatus Cloacimonadota bacterium]